MRAAVAALGDTHQRPRAADNRQQTRVPRPLSTPHSTLSWRQLKSSLNGSIIGYANDWCVIDACSERKRYVFAACAVTPRHCTLYHNKRTRPLTIHHFICFSLLFLLPVHLFCLSCPTARFAFSLPSFAIGYCFFCLLLLCHDYIGSHTIDSLDVVVLFSWVVLSLPLVLFSFATAFMICRGYYSCCD